VDPCSIVLELRENCDGEIDTTNLALLSKAQLRCPLGDAPKQLVSEELTLAPPRPLLFAQKSAYYQQNDDIVFLLPSSRVNFINAAKDPLFLAGEFNNWFDATKSNKFSLKLLAIDGQQYFALSLPIASLPDRMQFKFVSAGGTWIGPEMDAPNKAYAATNCVNYCFDRKKTGRHWIFLATREPMVIADEIFLKVGQSPLPVDLSPWLLTCYTDAELGARVRNGSTNFRIFMPRAHSARVLIYDNLHGKPEAVDMKREYDGTWSVEISADLHGKFYHYQALFGEESNWDGANTILDPYAKATCSHAGPAIVLNDHTFVPLRDNFQTHPMRDSVIIEAHVRDLLKNAPLRLKDEQRMGFNGLTKWLAKRQCYLRKIGANAVEFQPITESDARDRTEYHWGYMPVNFFSPASTYASSPAKAPVEFKKLVKACHRAGLGVILDVVYNHVGEQKNLQNIDRDYFFRKNDDGSLQNFSGCGNDLRTESPMVKRMIIDSLTHMIKTYGVDGFRFDLAELLGRELLFTIERELRLVKRDVQIIYEPWSFRDNIGGKLQNFSASAYNDEYRDFLAKYVHGAGNFDGMKYFLNGSMPHRSAFPYQSINYVESHDDMCWIDKITENWDHCGTHCSTNDRKRTHLALAILMASLGIPMLHAGQDMLQSKRGIGNTYRLGDVNALDYNLLKKNSQTCKFFRRWIAFRLSKRGAALRPEYVPSDGYLKFFCAPGTSAIGALYNADFSLPVRRLFFAANPHTYQCSLELGEVNFRTFRQLANGEKFFRFSKNPGHGALDKTALLQPLGLALFIE
jgi:pullulanase/glycogen debranching enzyme